MTRETLKGGLCISHSSIGSIVNCLKFIFLSILNLVRPNKNKQQINKVFHFLPIPFLVKNFKVFILVLCLKTVDTSNVFLPVRQCKYNGTRIIQPFINTISWVIQT